ncbi:MAG: aldehyde dehydrogenase family protein [Deltaproteobacteria bacterium]|nr:MAG: aldehyde dehydrogenase family protein [Deltaproteobacteria bacterium]
MAGVIEGDGPGGARIRCIDPRTGRPVAEVPCTPPDAIAGIVARARAAAPYWQAEGLRSRKRRIGALHQAFLARADDFVSLLAEECGRPAGEAWTAEVAANHDLFRWWLAHIDDLLVSTEVDLDPLSQPHKRGRVQLDAVGVVGLITPWNLPVALPLRTLVPALLAGDTVVFKPSEHSPRTGALIAELCAQVLPEGVVELVQGGAEVGAALVEAAPDAVVFTGSVATGRRVAAACAERFVPCSLELGGKDAALVLVDADLDRAVEGICWSAFAFGGQNCAAVERCFVDARIHDEFVDRLVARTRQLRPLLDVGPLITPAQLDRVQAHVADAVARGARIACGGTAPGPGWYHEPTVLTAVRDDMAVMTEETFGPVLPVAAFDDLDAVVDRIDASPFGLTASVWTRSLELGEAIACGLDCGVVTINNHGFTGALPSAAWGGTGWTGHGTTGSRHGLAHLVRPRTVVVDASRRSRELWWFPYNHALSTAVSGLVELSRRGGARLPGARAALTGLFARWKDRD